MLRKVLTGCLIALAALIVISCLLMLLLGNLFGVSFRYDPPGHASSNVTSYGAAAPQDAAAKTTNLLSTTCLGAPLSRMAKGGKGVVSYTTDHIPTRLRAGAGTGFAIIGSYPDGTPFTIATDDPVCADGYLWWHVRLDAGEVGWMAEGNVQKYFIQPSE